MECNDYRIFSDKAEEADSYNTQFWNRLQDEWKNIPSENDHTHPWTSEFNEFLDPYKVKHPNY